LTIRIMACDLRSASAACRCTACTLRMLDRQAGQPPRRRSDARRGAPPSCRPVSGRLHRALTRRREVRGNQHTLDIHHLPLLLVAKHGRPRRPDSASDSGIARGVWTHSGDVPSASWTRISTPGHRQPRPA
jgi:hypothetical protein